MEFSLVLMPLMLILLGIMQFGFIFNTYVTMANASREAARVGTVYAYVKASPDTAANKAVNDLARNELIKSQVVASMNNLTTSAPRFTVGSTWTQTTGSGTTTFTNGDLVITYVIPSGITDQNSRRGQQLSVQATYHQDLIVPIISNMLPKDAGGRLPLSGVVTMVIDG